MLLSCSCFPLQAQRYLGVRPTESGGPLMPEQAAYDVTFYDLQLKVNPGDSSIAGSLTTHAKIVHPVEWFVLDLDTTLKVSGIEILRKDQTLSLEFRHEAGKLWSHFQHTRQPGEQVIVRVHYGGRPRVAPRPPWIGGFTWARTADGQPWIATSNQSDGADLWWPCKDHPSDEPDSMAITITVPDPLIVASNGHLREAIQSDDGTRTYRWFVSTPINNYCVALNIAPYSSIEDEYESVTGESIPVTFWVLPENYQKGAALFPQFSEHLRFYERWLGPYPFRADKYGVAETPHLGMEHQTIIAYGNNYQDGPHGFDWLHHHELGHEWWGNLVTALDWRDFWIHEGFCLYMQALYAEELHGKEEYHKAMAVHRPKIRNQQPVAPRESRTTREIYYLAPDYVESDGDIYTKGAWVLHTLRYLIGDDALFKSLRRMAYPDAEKEKWTDGRQCRFVTTNDFLKLTEDISGMELDWFFEVYLRQPVLPTLISKAEKNKLTLQWQTPDNLPFPMPVEIKIGEKVQKVDLSQGKTVVKIPKNAAAEIDPDNWILMESQDKPQSDRMDQD